MLAFSGKRSNKRKGLVFEHKRGNSPRGPHEILVFVGRWISARCDEVVRVTFKKGLVLSEEEAPAWRVVKELYF